MILIQSFTFRRFLLGLPTNALNKIFMALYDKVDLNNYLFSIQRALLQRTGVQRFPRDIETANAIKEKDLYNIKAKNRTYLFEKIENFNNKENVIIEGNSEITVEHIFPQNPEIKWKRDLSSDEYNFIKENYLHTIGNLTLSGNNGKLSNKSFIEKREMNIENKEQGYRFSRLWLNRSLKEIESWNRSEIEKRAELIANRCLEIWAIPQIEFEQEVLSDEVNIFDADDPRYKTLDYAIFFDHKYEFKQVSKLYLEVFKQLFDLQPETFFASEIGKRISLTKFPDDDNLRQPVALNNTYYIESNIDNAGKFDRIKQALTIFGFEDELFIKYSDEKQIQSQLKLGL